MATARLKLGAGAATVDVPVSVPSDPVPPQDVLPAIRRLQDALVAAAEQVAARQARTISCKAGCSACCHQPVPLADIEVDALLELIERMPEPRRSALRQRFEGVERQLEANGLAERLRRLGDDGADDADVRAAANAYFRLGIPCPLLEDGACSIYADRPVTCRAYAVTSPAPLCADIESRDVTTLPALHLAPAVQLMSGSATSPRRRWSVLALAYDWRRRHPPVTERRSGPHWIGAMLKGLQLLNRL